MNIELKDVSPLQLIGAAIALAVFVKLIQGKGWPPILRTSGDGARKVIRKLLDR